MYYSYMPIYCQNPYCPNSPNFHRRQQLPDVDASLLFESAKETKSLMEDASIVLDKLADSEEFDTELMYAAQASDIDEVRRLIHTLGITSSTDVDYNPDGLNISFNSKINELDCCRLRIALRWR
ncbi:hypothetical protein [Virgibacillus siamensis]|uniref:hypothetical protein n=1 Tax=Virgibacillus siamensis TaxID=480071 RepID=UPI0009870CB5|nr:hypothetical protein [Virgibacillus siamensis]